MVAIPAPNRDAQPVAPEDYRAVGDGVTDDTAALQAALATGRDVALRDGKTYLHRQTLTVGTAGQIFDGRGSTVKRAAQAISTTTTSIASGVTSQITLASAASFRVGDQIVVEQGGSFDLIARTIATIVGNVVTITGTFGVTLSGTTNVRTGWAQFNVTGTDCRITQTVIDGNVSNWSWGRWQHMVAINTHSINGQKLLVDHCRILNQYGDGSTPASLGCTYAFNSFENIKGRGVVMSGNVGWPTNFTTRIIYNRFIGCNGDTAVGGTDGTSSIDFSQGGPSTVIQGNFVDGGVDGIGQLAAENNGDCTITDNEVWNCTGYGIKLVGSSQVARDVIVANNRVYNGNIEISGTTATRSRFTCKGNIVVNGSIVTFGADNVAIQGNIVDNTALVPPQQILATAVAGGGTFTAGTYYYKLTSVNSAGETTGSSEVSAVVALNGSVTLSWSIVPGATSYRIYRTTVAGTYGASTLLTTFSATGMSSSSSGVYTDTGTATGAGTIPGSNSTALTTVPCIQPGSSTLASSNLSVTDNHLIGGQYGVLIRATIAQMLVAHNVIRGSVTGGIFDTTTGNTNVSIHGNLITPDAATAVAQWTGINTQFAGFDVSENMIDITSLSGVIAAYGISVGGASANVAVRGNNLRATGGSTIALRVVTGASKTLVCNNRIIANLNSRLSDAGTLTTKFGNTYSIDPASGRAVLVAGTVTVSTIEVQTGDSILLSNVVAGGTLGTLSVGTITNVTSFVINSSNAADTSTVYWEIRH